MTESLLVLYAYLLFGFLPPVMLFCQLSALMGNTRAVVPGIAALAAAGALLFLLWPPEWFPGRPLFYAYALGPSVLLLALTGMAVVSKTKTRPISAGWRWWLALLPPVLVVVFGRQAFMPVGVLALVLGGAGLACAARGRPPALGPLLMFFVAGLNIMSLPYLLVLHGVDPGPLILVALLAALAFALVRIYGALPPERRFMAVVLPVYARAACGGLGAAIVLYALLR